jgi:hypothetical protein
MNGISQKSHAKVNISKNRLYITIAGKLSKENLDKLYTDIRFCVSDLKPSFDVINDISGCTLAALSGIPTFKKVTNYLIANRVGRVVRVIDERRIIFRQILNCGAKIQGYRARYVNNLDEAEYELEESLPEDGLRFYLQAQLVKYKIGEAQGDGYILDISTSGCTIKSAKLLPAIDDSVFFSTTFKEQENLIDDFEIFATVVEVEEDSFSITFNTLNDEQKENLWERLVHESHCEIGE